MRTNIVNTSPKESFKANFVIFFAVLAGLIFFVILAYFFVVKKTIPADPDISKIFMFIVPAFAVIEIFLSRFMYHKISRQITANANVFEKISKYRTAKIISWASLEGAGLFSVVAYLLTQLDFFLLIFLVVIAAFVLSKPSVEEFVNDLKIEGNDRNELL